MRIRKYCRRCPPVGMSWLSHKNYLCWIPAFEERQLVLRIKTQLPVNKQTQLNWIYDIIFFSCKNLTFFLCLFFGGSKLSPQVISTPDKGILGEQICLIIAIHWLVYQMSFWWSQATKIAQLFPQTTFKRFSSWLACTEVIKGTCTQKKKRNIILSHWLN